MSCSSPQSIVRGEFQNSWSNGFPRHSSRLNFVTFFFVSFRDGDLMGGLDPTDRSPGLHLGSRRPAIPTGCLTLVCQRDGRHLASDTLSTASKHRARLSLVLPIACNGRRGLQAEIFPFTSKSFHVFQSGWTVEWVEGKA